MSDQSKRVVIIDTDYERGTRLLPVIELLDYEALLLDSAQGLGSDALAMSDTVLVLVRDTSDMALLEQVAQTMDAANFPQPVFLLEAGGEYPDIPAALERRVVGTLPQKLHYRDILGALHEAEQFSAHDHRQRDDYSSHLFRTLVGKSRNIHYVRKLTRQVAASEASVLITGESGTGKEVVARNIHYYSQRRDSPFVPVNCGAIPAELLESELFGHEKGAFTGAYSARQGRFELAEGGTLFLDEIGDMPLNMQVKLLRVLQEHSFERVGSNTTLKSDVRIVAATHQNLEQLVAEGKFRMDLYYRLNVFPIDVPPLRDRVEDIPMLLKGFIHRMEQEKRGTLKVNTCALAALSKYYWPGNVRELANLVERLAILYPKQLVKWSELPEKFRPNHDWIAEQLEDPQIPLPHAHDDDFVPTMDLPVEGLDLKEHLADIECSLMTQALEQSDWVVARAAKLLNLQRTTLVEKMRKYAIARPEDVPEF